MARIYQRIEPKSKSVFLFQVCHQTQGDIFYGDTGTQGVIQPFPGRDPGKA